MKLIQINPHLSISDQIILEDINKLAQLGVKTIICNRPDGEEPNQLSASQIKLTAEKTGIKFVDIPVSGRVIPESSLKEFIEVLKSTDQKVHAYCRTGMRSSIFWGLSRVQQKSVNQVLSEAHSLGFDLSPITEQLERARQTSNFKIGSTITSDS